MSPKKLCPLLRVVVIAALPTLALARLEPVTQIFFPDERAGQPLVGVGARELGKQLQSHLSFSTRFLRVRTWWSRAPDPQLQMYAVGLYAHRIGLQLALLKLKGEERAASELPPGFFEAVCGGFAKTIVIKMACSMSREQIAGEFVESVQQRMGSGGSKELEALQEIIQKGCADAEGGSGGKFPTARGRPRPHAATEATSGTHAHSSPRRGSETESQRQPHSHKGLSSLYRLVPHFHSQPRVPVPALVHPPETTPSFTLPAQPHIQRQLRSPRSAIAHPRAGCTAGASRSRRRGTLVLAPSSPLGCAGPPSVFLSTARAPARCRRTDCRMPSWRAISTSRPSHPPSNRAVARASLRCSDRPTGRFVFYLPIESLPPAPSRQRHAESCLARSAC